MGEQGHRRPSRRRGAVLAALLLCVVAVPAPAFAEAAAEGGSVGAGNTVAIPYESTMDAKPAEGWTITDCAAVLAATPLATACSADTISFAAPDYDPEAGTVRVPVAMSNGSVSTTIDYFVSLEAPEAPSFAEAVYGYPLPAGARILLPISDLGISCTDCDEHGAQIVVEGVAPAEAGTLEATATHLVLTAAPGYTGDAELQLSVRDDGGQSGAITPITVRLVPSLATAAGALHIVTPVDGDSTELDLLDAAAAGEALSVIGCGAPVLGTVRCGEGGAASITLPSGVDIDQFSFHIVDAAGDQSTGSVTVVRAGSEAAETLATADGPALAGAIGAEETASLVPVRVPPAEPGDEGAGVLTGFLGLLDRIGA